MSGPASDTTEGKGSAPASRPYIARDSLRVPVHGDALPLQHPKELAQRHPQDLGGPRGGQLAVPVDVDDPSAKPVLDEISKKRRSVDLLYGPDCLYPLQVWGR